MLLCRHSTIRNFYPDCTPDETKTVCGACGDRVSRRGKTYTTSNLRKHLQARHHSQFKAFEEVNRRMKTAKEQSTSESSCDSWYHQLSVQSSVDKRQQFPFDHPQSCTITKLISEFIAIDCQPFSIVEGIGFVQHLEPRYKLPSRRFRTWTGTIF